MFETFPVAHARLDGDAIRELAAWESVRRVKADREVELLNNDSQEDTGAREVWGAEEFGYRGGNVEVAIIDSGVDAKHPGLLDSVAANYQYAGDPFSGDVTWVDVSPGQNDGIGHGTHCAGSLCGDGTGSVLDDYAGMAPEATLTAYAFPGLAGTLSTTVAAYDHLVRGKQNGDHDIQLVSNSWGGSGEYDPFDPVVVAAYSAFEEEILSVFAAGNSGPDAGTMGQQQPAPFVMSIAATDADQSVTDFSSRGDPERNLDRRRAVETVRRLYDEELDAEAVDGPVGLYRPAVAAKGGGVVSTQSGEQGLYGLGAVSSGPEEAAEPLYVPASGTSMACPTVAGCVTLFLDAYVDANGEFPDPIDTINTLEATADPAPGSGDDSGATGGYTAINAGAGYVDAVAAVERALADDLADYDDVELAPEP